MGQCRAERGLFIVEDAVKSDASMITTPHITYTCQLYAVKSGSYETITLICSTRALCEL